jgi:3-hydroxybutyryl-CoA dehydrogenase
MSQSRFGTASVVGTGMMGPGIALTLALGGIRVTLLSRTAQGAAMGVEKAREQGRVLSGNQLAGAAEVQRALQLLGGSTDFEGAVSAADLVVESGPEDLGWKQELFGRMDGLTRPDAVLASNTSGLSISAIARDCRRGERVLTTHFWNPPHLMPLVEIVLGERTSAVVAGEVRDLLAGCGKTPVVVRKDRPGQLGNRLQMALVREAAKHCRRRHRRCRRRGHSGEERFRAAHAGLRHPGTPGRGRARSGAARGGVRGAGPLQ